MDVYRLYKLIVKYDTYVYHNRAVDNFLLFWGGKGGNLSVHQYVEYTYLQGDI